MKLSISGMGTIRINNLDEMYPIQDMLLQSGQIVQYEAGIFAYGNVVMLVKRNIEQVIREELNKAGLIEVQLPTLQPEKIWQASNRWQKYIDDGVMFTIMTDKGNYCMAPTAEEAVVEFAREKLKSYKHLPVNFYQIGEKYRHEIRTRGYMLRGKSFLMMDAYSFDEDFEGLDKSYKATREAYLNISKRLHLNAIPVVADNGDMGGKKSEEFMVISPIGEDTILYDESTGVGLNTEILERPDYKEYLKTEYNIEDISKLQEKKSIEIGHIFQLGTRYSETMNATYTSKDGKNKPYVMGCYGIGVSRVMAAIYENSRLTDKDGKVVGISLPKNIAPYIVQIIPKLENEEKFNDALNFYEKMNGHAILDDREKVSMGEKIKDTKVYGTPFIAILGDKVESGNIELEETKTGEKQVLTIEEAVEFLNKQMEG